MRQYKLEVYCPGPPSRTAVPPNEVQNIVAEDWQEALGLAYQYMDDKRPYATGWLSGDGSEAFPGTVPGRLATLGFEGPCDHQHDASPT